MTSAPERPVRVGVFGLLGSGNLGNDGSLEAVLGLPPRRPPGRGRGRPVRRTRGRERPGSGSPPPGCTGTAPSTGPRHARARSRRKGLGKFVDIFRTAAWVRKHDVVIVPGMGVLEATLPLRPWGFPYSLFLLCASGRLTRTRVALVSVGAAEIRNRPTRALVRWSGRLAAVPLLPGRPIPGRDAGDGRGHQRATRSTRTSPSPCRHRRRARPRTRRGTVCVGVMDFHGGNDDRARADEIYAALPRRDDPVRPHAGRGGQTGPAAHRRPCDATVVAAILDAVDSPAGHRAPNRPSLAT
jgi:hypothetical protein